MLTRVAAIACIAIAIACRATTPTDQRLVLTEGSECYAIAYKPTDDAGAFPSRIALAPGTDGARAAWLPASTDTLGIWRMFQYDAAWQRGGGDSITVRFGNGFSGVMLVLAPRDSVRDGQAQWQSDVIGQNPVPTALTATGMPCSEFVTYAT